MAAENQNVTMHAGDSKTIRITVKDENADVVDLTSATARYWFGDSAYADADSATAVPVKKSTLSGGGITIDTDASSPAFYRVNITLDPADTENLTAKAYYHECEVIDSSGNVSTVMTGTITLTKSLIPTA